MTGAAGGHCSSPPWEAEASGDIGPGPRQPTSPTGQSIAVPHGLGRFLLAPWGQRRGSWDPAHGSERAKDHRGHGSAGWKGQCRGKASWKRRVFYIA